jgi:hypothetical protein
MLELRPNCECCDKDLPPDSPEAFICSFECTFCRDCMTARLRSLPELRRRTGAAPCASRRGAAAAPRLHPAPPCTVKPDELAWQTGAIELAFFILISLQKSATLRRSIASQMARQA